VTSAGSFHSILFDRPEAAAEREDPSLFGDLNLDQIFAAVAAGHDEYDLAPFFRTPLGDVPAVQYRHEVQRDLADEALREAVTEFAARLRDMRKYLAQAAKLRNPYQKERPALGPDKPGGDRLPAARAGRLHRRAPDSQRPLPGRRDGARRGEEDHRLALP
jgi:hypothetical protein